MLACLMNISCEKNVTAEIMSLHYCEHVIQKWTLFLAKQPVKYKKIKSALHNIGRKSIHKAFMKSHNFDLNLKNKTFCMYG